MKKTLRQAASRRLASWLLAQLAIAFTAAAQDLYDPARIPEIRITFAQADWHQRLDSMKMAGSADRLPATVSVDGKTVEGAGVRFKGNSSFKNPRQKGFKKLPFNLKANFTQKDRRFPGGYETIKLSNVFQDPSFLREVLSYDIARKYMAAPRANFAKVWVNGEYFGLYNNTESVDETFLEKTFGSGKGALIKCDPDWEDVKDLENGCPEGDKAALMHRGDDPKCYRGWYEVQSSGGKESWQELIALTKTLATGKPEAIAAALNVDAALWMHAFNQVTVNLDSYTGRLSHNYYLYKTPDGLFTPIVWDMNISLGGFRFDGEKQGVLTNEELQDFSLFVHYKNKNPKRPLLVNLLAHPLWRKIYVGHCRTILMQNFASGEYLRRAAEVRKLVDAEVKNDPNKLYSYQDFLKNLSQTVDIGSTEIIGIEELMKKRTEKLLAHPVFNSSLPVVGNVKHILSGTSLTVSTKASDVVQVWLAWRGSPAEPFKMTDLFDDGAHGDGAAADGVWSAAVEGKVGTQYYLVGEGKVMATCSPERAAFEFYEVK